jgi:hypothetical protein
MTQTTTRRDLLRIGTSAAAYAAGAAIVTGSVALAGEAKSAPVTSTRDAATASPPGEVEAAFTEWKATRAMLNASTDEDGTESPEHPVWAKLSQAEATIRDSAEVGPRVAEIRLWLSITGDLIYTKENEALHREDADWLLANADEPEFTTIMALRAIKALRGEA